MSHFLFTSFRWQKNQQWKKSFFNIIFFAFGLCTWLICHPSFVVANDLSQDDQEAQKEKLQPLQSFIGGWKGVAMQKLGGQDRWAAEAEWAWSFDGGIPAIVFELSPGRFFTRGQIIPGAEENTFILRAHHAETDTVDTYSGFMDENKQLEFTNQVIQISRPARLLIKTLADHKRLVITLQYGSNEKRLQQGATLGYTRKGTVFATRSRPLHECVVTGGEGNQQVSHNGETYWVCCKGCLSMFEANPEKVIAAYEARQVKEQENEQSQ